VRGELVRLPARRGARGGEQRGARYGVVVQSDLLLGLSTALVAPTSTRALATAFRPLIEIEGVETRVLVEQTRAVAVDTLGPSLGRLDPLERAGVDEALRLVLGL